MVGGQEALAGGDVHAQDVLPAAAGLGLPAGQGGAVDELHGDEQLTIDLADLVDLDYIGRRYARQRLRLAEDARPQLAVALPRGVDQLERDLAVELFVVGGVHDAHRAFAELAQKDIAADGAVLAAGDELARGRRAELGQRAVGWQGQGGAVVIVIRRRHGLSQRRGVEGLGHWLTGVGDSHASVYSAWARRFYALQSPADRG